MGEKQRREHWSFSNTGMYFTGFPRISLGIVYSETPEHETKYLL